MPIPVILLVEDNHDDELLTFRAFKKSNIMNEVVVARDGVEALDFLFCTGAFAARNADIKPGVILLDLKIPKIDGMEVLRRIRACDATRLIPVVILTSSDEDQDILAAYSIGANSYIRKPVNLEIFIRIVGQIGLYWLLHNEAPPPFRDGSGTRC